MLFLPFSKLLFLYVAPGRYVFFIEVDAQKQMQQNMKIQVEDRASVDTDTFIHWVLSYD